MTDQIRFTPIPGQMSGTLAQVPAFPGDNFLLNIPEAIGDASQVCRDSDVTLAWTPIDGGAWVCNAQRAGELSYVLNLTPGYDTVDVEISVTNESHRTWAKSMAFNCVHCAFSHAVSDHECVRHWGRVGGEFKSLISVPRKYSARPTVQVYNVAGMPPAQQIPFAANFDATPNVALEGWLAIQSRDGQRLAATVSRPTLFLFQNMEYSCIHACPSFGALAPGQTSSALTRVYLTCSSLADWCVRMQAELGL